MSEHWDERARAYDRLGWVHHHGLLSWIAGLVRASLRDGSDSERAVLEVGCGTGALTERLAGIGRVRLTAIDVSREMVRAASSRVDGVEFVQVDDRDYVAEGYDAVVSRMVLHHAMDPAESIRRWAARTVRGGAVVVAEGPPPVADASHPAVDLYRAAMALKEPGRHVFHAHDIAEWMIGAGCVEVQVHERFSAENSLLNWLLGNPMEAWRRRAIVELHREGLKSDVVREAYRMEEHDGDVLMRWRHCTVVGRVDR